MDLTVNRELLISALEAHKDRLETKYREAQEKAQKENKERVQNRKKIAEAIAVFAKRIEEGEIDKLEQEGHGTQRFAEGRLQIQLDEKTRVHRAHLLLVPTPPLPLELRNTRAEIELLKMAEGETVKLDESHDYLRFLGHE